MKRALLLVSALCWASGCGGSLLASGFRSTHPECDEHVNFNEREHMPGVFDAWACGIRETAFRVPATTRFNIAGEAIRLASFELRCDPEEMSLSILDRDHVGVEGCGRRLLYMSTRNGWILNSLVDASIIDQDPPPARPTTLRPARLGTGVGRFR